MSVPADHLSDHREPEERIGFHTSVDVRWSDMDVYQHINHARMVTLLEEARIPWLLVDGRPTANLRHGAVIADLHVKYRGQLRHEDGPLDVFMWIDKVRAVDFVAGYEVRANGASLDTPAAIIASTQIAAFDIDTQKLRRLTAEEREYLESWQRV
ncbi:MAG: thioesterase family protein [Rhodococcus fascians]|uniref:acyl-CoA thioesterase n=1 Tax=Rhodococcoides fascians TaxID=1828 RepID=UPI00068674E6|nr:MULTISPECIES: thioesterase family protein [Rhodococcus]OZC45979.1 thioesterase [Rhodococcus sp. 06-621-2]OZC85415.1 thioesterase [Rhodococcus sp. 06-418-1B]OZD73028.1 thioesterase [Rhodococcus sp. 06-1059B-a]OZF01111.1 thioesterase [Rhodococcus sp. 15-1154-1]